MIPFSIVALRILPDNAPYMQKTLKEGWYLFNSIYKLNSDETELIHNGEYPLADNFFAENISVNAIVGKNGSGKTSVLDFVLRIINNLTERLLQNCNEIKRNSAEDFYCINNLNVELYFVLDSQLCCLKSTSYPYAIQIDLGKGFQQFGTNLDVNATNNQVGEQDITWETVRTILDNFFYTLVVNYSLHAYNRRDYSDECEEKGKLWVNSLFHKNDGYLAPLVITPYRGEEETSNNQHCIIDIDKEFNLANSRLSALLLQHKCEAEQAQKEKKKELQDFIDGYQLDLVTFHYDDKYVNSKYIFKTKDDEGHEDENEYAINLEKNDSVFFAYIDAYNLPKLDTHNKLKVDAYKYLVYKTNMISVKYPSYRNYYKVTFIGDFDKNCNDSAKQQIKKLINKIQSDNSQ